MLLNHFSLAVMRLVFLFFFLLLSVCFLFNSKFRPVGKIYLAVILFNLGKSHYLLKNFF